jgi:hypothetical protein
VKSEKRANLFPAELPENDRVTDAAFACTAFFERATLLAPLATAVAGLVHLDEWLGDRFGDSSSNQSTIELAQTSLTPQSGFRRALRRSPPCALIIKPLWLNDLA